MPGDGGFARVIDVLPEMVAALGETGLMVLITVPIAIVVAIPAGVLLWVPGLVGCARHRACSWSSTRR